MHGARCRFRHLLTLVLSVAAFTANVPTTTAQNSGGFVSSWGVAVRFPGTPPQLEVTYYTYVMQDSSPPVLVLHVEEDITGDCQINNPSETLSFDGAYAIFDGATSISCELPSWRQRTGTLNPALPAANNDIVNCPVSGGSKWVAADVRLDAVSSSNPLVDASALGISFSLPTSPQSAGFQARTRMILSSGSISSPAWNVDPIAGNRMLLGQNGPQIVVANALFDRLSYLNSAWETRFATQVGRNGIGSWSEAPNRFLRQSSSGTYALGTGKSTMYIGYSPSNNAYFRGRVAAIDIDPGCLAG